MRVKSLWSGSVINRPRATNDVQAVILAGGRGQRLRPITDYVPKPLTPLANIPLLEWQLRYLDGFGVRDVVVCSGYKTDLIENYLAQRGRDRVSVSAEDKPLGTAGAIQNASDTIKGEFYVLNGDVITDIDIRTIPPNHIAAVPLRTQFGVLGLDGDRVSSFGEKTQLPGMWMNAGIYRLGRDTLKLLPEKGDIERTLFPDWASAGRLGAARFPDARWHSIDSFKDIDECAPQVEDIVCGGHRARAQSAGPAAGR